MISSSLQWQGWRFFPWQACIPCNLYPAIPPWFLIFQHSKNWIQSHETPGWFLMSVDDWHCEMGQVQSPQIMSIVSWQHLNGWGSLDSTSPLFHSFLSRQFVSNPYLKGQDGMVELDYVSDQKHLTAMNSMTVGSIILICVITKAVRFHW